MIPTACQKQKEWFQLKEQNCYFHFPFLVPNQKMKRGLQLLHQSLEMIEINQVRCICITVIIILTCAPMDLAPDDADVFLFSLQKNTTPDVVSCHAECNQALDLLILTKSFLSDNCVYLLASVICWNEVGLESCWSLGGNSLYLHCIKSLLSFRRLVK